jgi:hypothetical protein
MIFLFNYESLSEEILFLYTYIWHIFILFLSFLINYLHNIYVCIYIKHNILSYSLIIFHSFSSKSWNSENFDIYFMDFLEITQHMT